jgi:hypothetical protein
MAIDYRPFEADYGFLSPGFSVDAEGNLVAKSISLENEEQLASFVVTNTGQSFVINGENSNPTIEVEKGSTFVFTLALDADADWNIYNADGTYFDEGISFEDVAGGVFEGRAAQGKREGTFTWKIPVDAPDNLKYGNSAKTSLGDINVALPTLVGIGQFEQLTVTGVSALQRTTIGSTINSTSTTTGALTVAGGVGIVQNVNIGGSLNAGATNVSSLDTSTLNAPSLNNDINLALNAQSGNIVFNISGSAVATLTTNGIETDIVNSTIENTPIGAVTPNSGAFTSATVENKALEAQDVTNKDYVDTTITALAIALGV